MRPTHSSHTALFLEFHCASERFTHLLYLEQAKKHFRERCTYGYLLTRNRMDKALLPAVEQKRCCSHLPVRQLYPLGMRKRRTTTCTVKRIPHDRESPEGQVHPDLMLSASLGRYKYE